MKRLAVVPGSFDPVTVGHADLVLRAADLFGEVLVLVMNNREKEYLFSLDERFELCQGAFAGDKRIRVDKSEGMLYEYLLEKKEKTVLVKGVRDETDFLYEREMAKFNFLHCGVQTLYLDAKEELGAVSSTLVREKIKKKESLSGLLPEKVIKLLQNKL